MFLLNKYVWPIWRIYRIQHQVKRSVWRHLVWREEMAMQRHTDRNGKEPTTWKVTYNTAEGEVKGCKCRVWNETAPGLNTSSVISYVALGHDLTSLSLRFHIYEQNLPHRVVWLWNDSIKWHVVSDNVKGRKDGKERESGRKKERKGDF